MGSTTEIALWQIVLIVRLAPQMRSELGATGLLLVFAHRAAVLRGSGLTIVCVKFVRHVRKGIIQFKSVHGIPTLLVKNVLGATLQTSTEEIVGRRGLACAPGAIVLAGSGPTIACVKTATQIAPLAST
jgi:hypothetical protein